MMRRNLKETSWVNVFTNSTRSISIILFFIDFTITITISFIDHFLKFFISHTFTNLFRDTLQVLQADLASFLIIKQSKRFKNFFSRIFLALQNKSTFSQTLDSQWIAKENIPSLLSSFPRTHWSQWFHSHHCQYQKSFSWSLPFSVQIQGHA